MVEAGKIIKLGVANFVFHIFFADIGTKKKRQGGSGIQRVKRVLLQRKQPNWVTREEG